ncbi:MAG: lysophospholipid acyltransferase family protein [Acidimicrobiales bacterium]
MSSETAPQAGTSAAPPLAAAVVHPPTRAELAWYHFAWTLLYPPCWLMWRANVVGKENLPQTVPYILAPVHRSYIDTFLAAYVTTRRLRFMAKEEVFSKAWLAKLFGSLGGFPVRRGTPDREALQMCERALAGGEPVVLFPEGTRRSGPEVQPLFAGPAFVALRANVPIVPVGIGGSDRSMPPGAKWVRPVRVGVVIGRPIWPPPQSPSGRVPRSSVTELTERLRSELQAVFDQARELAGS